MPLATERRVHRRGRHRMEVSWVTWSIYGRGDKHPTLGRAGDRKERPTSEHSDRLDGRDGGGDS